MRRHSGHSQPSTHGRSARDPPPTRPRPAPHTLAGRRTTLRLTAAPFSGFRERDDEAVVATWCPENSKCGLKQELETLLDKKARRAFPPRAARHAWRAAAAFCRQADIPPDPPPT